MATLEHRDFTAPDETRRPDKTTVALVNIAGGEVYRIGPGHDAWVDGNEQFVSVEFQGAANYAKPS